MKDNKNVSMMYISNRRKALLAVQGNKVTENEEKIEMLNAFFASVCNVRPAVPWASSPQSWKARMRRRKKLM